MKTDPKTGQRFFDEEDFTPTHDGIFLSLLKGDVWKPLVVRTVSLFEDARVAKGGIVGEPPLEGYPPVFPDAIAKFTLERDHRSVPPGLAWWSPGSRNWDSRTNNLWIRCGAKDCTGSVVGGRASAIEKALYDWVDPEDWPRAARVMIDEAPLPPLKETCAVEYRGETAHFQVVLEIKPKIDSFGRTLRQLQLYRQRASSPDYVTEIVLVTPVWEYDESFNSQGVTVVHPTPASPWPVARRGGLA